MLQEHPDTLAAMGQLYERQLAAKDETIAALWRRVGAAEQERDLCREELAARPAAPPLAAPAPPIEDRLAAAYPAGSWRAERSAGGGRHTSVAVYRVEPGTAERLLQRLQWRLLPRFRRRPGFLGYQLLASDAETAVAISLWASRAEAEWAARAVEGVRGGSAYAMAASVATRVAALAPPDAGEPGWAAGEATAAAVGLAPPVAPWRRQRARTAD